MSKLGIHYAYWETDWNADADSYVKSIKRASDIGFEVLELAAASFYDMSKSDMDKVREASIEYNVNLAYSFCFTPDMDVSSGDAAKRKRGIEWVQQVLKNIGYMKLEGAGIGGITYGVWHGLIEDTKKAHWERAVESVKEIIKVAEDNDVIYLLETVNRFENFLLNVHYESLQFAKEVDSPNIKVHLDTFHMNVEEDDFEAAIVNTGDMIGYFHLGESNRKPPGTGKLDWDTVFAALSKINYQKSIVMEPFVVPENDVAKDVALYRDLRTGEDMNAVAAKALSFVKEKLLEYSQ